MKVVVLSTTKEWNTKARKNDNCHDSSKQCADGNSSVDLVVQVGDAYQLRCIHKFDFAPIKFDDAF